MEVAGSILRSVFFFVKISTYGTGGGVAGSIPDELRKKKIGTVPVHLGYVHLLFHTFSVQLICLGYVHYLFNDISGGAIF